MTELTDEEKAERAAVLAEARATVERLNKIRPHAAPPEPAEWRRPRPEPAPTSSRDEASVSSRDDTSPPIDWDARIADAVECGNRMMDEAVGLALGQLMDEQRREFQKIVDTEINLLRLEMKAAVAERAMALSDRMCETINQLQALVRGKAEPIDLAPARDAKFN
jgi:hypothetical protein